MIKKQKPSGFFGTNLTSYLTLLGCDSVIVVGITTSGCVRATVVDSFSLNYRVTLAEEGWTAVNLIFVLMNQAALRQGIFPFGYPDFLGMPANEFLSSTDANDDWLS